MAQLRRCFLAALPLLIETGCTVDGDEGQGSQTGEAYVRGRTVVRTGCGPAFHLRVRPLDRRRQLDQRDRPRPRRLDRRERGGDVRVRAAERELGPRGPQPRRASGRLEPRGDRPERQSGRVGVPGRGADGGRGGGRRGRDRRRSGPPPRQGLRGDAGLAGRGRGGIVGKRADAARPARGLERQPGRLLQPLLRPRSARPPAHRDDRDRHGQHHAAHHPAAQHSAPSTSCPPLPSNGSARSRAISGSLQARAVDLHERRARA